MSQSHRLEAQINYAKREFRTIISAKFLRATMFVEKLVQNKNKVFGWPLTPKHVAQVLGWSIQSQDSGSDLSDSRQASAMASGHRMTDRVPPVSCLQATQISVNMNHI